VRLKILLSATILVGLTAYGWLSVQTFLARGNPEHWHALTLGPPADVLERAAADRIGRGIEALNDRARAPAERLRAYRSNLEAAESLLTRSLAANPARARVLASLAAVRWELRSPLSDGEAAELLEMIETASRMAHAAPRTQMQLGEVLLKMGKPSDALTYFSRAVTLDEELSRRAITILRDHRFRAQEILEALPRRNALLTALRMSFQEDDDDELYIEALERAIEMPLEPLSRELLIAYGSSCLRMRAASRLLRTMHRMPESDDDAVEAARLHQISRAHLQLGEPALAIEKIKMAISKEPQASYLAMQLGEAAIAAGEPEIAIEAFRRALGLLARSSSSPQARAALYGKIGQAEELRGDMGRAYDAYRMALELDPQEPHAGRRLREMREAAGLGPS
jgi:tetratricopeptide (TPR) repeat protein